MKYRHLFFDLDHTLWDFETNSRLTLDTLYTSLSLEQRGIDDFDRFHKCYLEHNEKMWDRYRKGFIKVDELRWKRFWLTLLDFKIGDEKLARQMAVEFLDLLPTRTALFPDTLTVLDYLKDKGYTMHLITNGFEKTQHSKLEYSGIASYFVEVITSEGSNSLKPHKEIFDYALSKAKTIATDSIMIGDDPEVDIKGAKNAGLDQIYVNHINKKIDFTPTYTVYNLKELMGIL
ncbi:MAG: noncanonical pyrimidine nucleotidase, YjjG family [Chitinophagaceae bacterium]|nr:noncanonical pyrimidine nucleotidase, YjjG family [Chitinophagaceae bacterium]